MCKGSGPLRFTVDPKKLQTYFFDPAKHLPAPWVALQGTIDQVCLPQNTQDFVEKVGNGRIVMLPKVGHGYSVQKNWMPQFKQVFAEMTAINNVAGNRSHLNAPMVADLPLVALAISAGNKDRLAIIISGDGGWAGIDKSVGEALNTSGIPVVGLDALQYFWRRKSPEQSAKDLGRIIRHYSDAWNRKEVLLIGYSRGADVLPFMLNRLGEREGAQVKEVVLLGPGQSVDFQFHVIDWLRAGTHDTALPVLPEMQRLRHSNVLCLYGSDEKNESLCPQLDNKVFK